MALLVECLTDNRNRAAMEVRTAMTRSGGTMADPGSVSYLFTRKGVILVPVEHEGGTTSEDDVLMAVLDAGAEEVNDLDGSFEVICEPTDLVPVRTALQDAGLDYDSAEVSFVPSVSVEVDVSSATKILRLVDALEDLDDVQNVFSNLDASDEVMAQAMEQAADPTLGQGDQARRVAAVGRGRPTSLSNMRSQTVRVLGVDPGLTRCGVGIVDGSVGRPLTLVDVGVVRTPADLDIARRLHLLEQGIEAAIIEHRPDVVAVERVFSQHNVRTVMGTAQASGIAMVVAARHGIEVRLHTPERGQGGRHRQRPRRQGPGRPDGGPAAPPHRAAQAGRRRRRARPGHLPGLARRRRRPARRRSRQGGRPMIAFVRGRVAALTLNAAVVDVGGVGYHVFCTPGTIADLRLGAETQLATSMVVREDSSTLYGFADVDERDMFELVQTASGVGPKVAQAMLAVLPPDRLRSRPSPVPTTRPSPPCPASGARVPSASSSSSRTASAHPSRPSSAGGAGWRDQVRDALQGLGWSTRDADQAVDTVAADHAHPSDGTAEPDVPTLLRAALRTLSKA